jgi:hypothetical protein
MDRITIYNGVKYSLGFTENYVNLYSLDDSLYPSIFNLLKRSDLPNAYQTRIWVKIRGCEALYNGIVDGYVLLDVRPSNDVEILEAKMVERDVYHARLPVSEIESMWEERMPYLDYPFPEGLPTKEEIEIPN